MTEPFVLKKKHLNYDAPIEIGKGVFWVGYVDEMEGLHCNPYLIIDGNEAVLIDGGSRPDFSTVMMKIMETGLSPSSIKALIYQHYDPDLCGSIPNLEDIIQNPELKVLSHRDNNMFIRYYAVTSPLLCVESLGFTYTFGSGRTLRFIRTPYSHSSGSFITFDETSGILFTSDLFGSYSDGNHWGLIHDLPDACLSCTRSSTEIKKPFVCTTINSSCSLPGIFRFHRKIMTSNKALGHAMKLIEDISPSLVAPQHGSIFYKKEDIQQLIRQLKNLNDVGIDGVTG